MEPCCAVCGESKISNLYMFNYGMCLCHRCMETAAQTFVHDSAERKLKESEADVEGLSKAEYESMRELKDKLLKEIEAAIEAKKRVAEEAIKFANGTHESLSCKCPGCGKAVHPSLITRVHGKYGGLPDRLCPDCLKKYKLKKAEEAAQILMADLSIENNMLRTRLKDLKEEYESFRERTSRVWWGVAVAGFAISTLVTLMFLNPK